MRHRIGILRAGRVSKELSPKFGDYPAILRRFLGEFGFEFVDFDVVAGELPRDVEACAGYIVTGSTASVFESHSWIADLRTFLVQAKGRAALVGICFGHQIMADAFGGKVIRSPKGWGVGLHRYEVYRREAWMDASPFVSAPASHQDQVVDAPATARVVAGCAFTPVGMIAYVDQPAVSIQLHPEASPELAKAAIELGRGRHLSDPQIDLAIASLAAPHDCRRIGQWIGHFLSGARSLGVDEDAMAS